VPVDFIQNTLDGLSAGAYQHISANATLAENHWQACSSLRR